MTELIATGQVIDQRYEILSLLGQGGIGAVYKARQIQFDRLVALKVLHCGLNTDKDSLSRFWQEGKILCALQHTNIVACLASGLWQGSKPYLVFEYLDGQTLRQFLDKSTKMSWSEAVRIAIEVCAGLDYAHASGVVHRDLKPENILLVPTDAGQLAKILDFGLARIVHGNLTAMQKLTQTGALMGSVLYMSPEQCTGQRAGPRADLYALGCIMYEVICGRPPHMADDPMGIVYKHAQVDPEPIAQLADVPPDLANVINKCLSRDPDKRYQTARALQTDLETSLAGGMLATSGPASRQATTKSLQKVLAAGALLILIGVVVFALSDPGLAPLAARITIGRQPNNQAAQLETLLTG